MSDEAFEADLLLGVLAARTGLIDDRALVAAVAAWSQAGGRLRDFLRSPGGLDDAAAAALRPLAERHAADRGGPAASLAALSSADGLFASLWDVGDTQVNGTLPPTVGPPTLGAGESGPGGSGVEVSLPAGVSRYRVIRPHAEGGLGKVSVAEDLELGREIIFKEIKDRFADDPEARGRFLLEAEVTGGLEHPGVVPVYGLGAGGDGRPYYAMRFIRGDSLKDAADKLHRRAGRAGPDFASVDFRKLVGRLVDVCQAVAYAHSRGVLHRDLKPGNVMLGKYGETLVVDWGLAKVAGRSDAGDGEATLTVSSGSGSMRTQAGRAVGTPAFMPPEQAAGRLEEVGPRSDVYSLGATLHYLLTAGPSVEARDLPGLLAKVEAGDVTAPRARLASVPAALEAVCLKAMARRPADRYAGPAELAEDLERWLADEPVAAAKEPWAARARRWVRKHPTLVTSTAAALLVGAVGSAAFGSALAGKNEALESANAALTASGRAEAAARHEAEVSAEAARAQAGVAVDALVSALADIDEAVTGLPGGARVRRRLLDTALAGFEDVAEDLVGGGRLRADRVGLLIRFADLLVDLGGEEGGGGLGAAGRFADEAVALAERRADEEPGDAAAAALSDALSSRGRVLGESGRSVEALGAYRRALREAERIGGEDAGWTTANALEGVAYQSMRIGHLAEAEEARRRMLADSGAALRARPESLSLRRRLFNDYRQLALVLIDRGRLGEAAGLRESALRIARGVARDDPESLKSRDDLAIALFESADSARFAGRLEEAAAVYEEGLTLFRRLAAESPENVRLGLNLGTALLRAGRSDEEAGRPEAAAGRFAEAGRLHERLAALSPGHVGVRDGLKVSRYREADLARVLGRPEARRLSEEGLAAARALIRGDPDNLRRRWYLFTRHIELALKLALSDAAAAADHVRRGSGVLAAAAARLAFGGDDAPADDIDRVLRNVDGLTAGGAAD